LRDLKPSAAKPRRTATWCSMPRIKDILSDGLMIRGLKLFGKKFKASRGDPLALLIR
jgi:hypothetical protein